PIRRPPRRTSADPVRPVLWSRRRPRSRPARRLLHLRTTTWSDLARLNEYVWAHFLSNIILYDVPALQQRPVAIPTSQISDPAPLSLDCQPERHRRVRCIWRIRRHGQNSVNLVSPSTATTEGWGIPTPKRLSRHKNMLPRFRQ